MYMTNYNFSEKITNENIGTGISTLAKQSKQRRKRFIEMIEAKRRELWKRRK